MTDPPLIEDLINRLAVQTMAYPYKVWGYGEEMGLQGLLAASDVTSEPAYFEFVHGLMDAWVASRPEISYPDHVAPGSVLLEIYQRTGDQRLLEQARHLAQFFADLPRASSGTARHRPDHPEFSQYAYVDCIPIDGPFLCRFADLTGETSFFDLGVDLLLSHVRVLQDEDSGLFYHLYDCAHERTNGAFWGRGNGWAILGLIDILELLGPADPARPQIQTFLERQAAALARLQDSSGHWHTVLNQPNTYLETSLAAFFCVAFTRAVDSGLLSTRYLESARAAWVALVDSIDAHGLVQGVSYATPPGDAVHYQRAPVGGLYPWGQGPALLAATASCPSAQVMEANLKGVDLCSRAAIPEMVRQNPPEKGQNRLI